MAVNKYPASCASCGQRVPANGGQLHRSGSRWLVTHPACSEAGRPQVVSFAFGSGATITRNINGRCEDAPCCGCCT